MELFEKKIKTSPSSFHPSGRAFDMRPEGIAIDEHRKALGSDFDIIDHGTPPHRHIEYDPKG
jgi:hypothetical protein